MSSRYELRLTKAEKAIINKLARSFNLSSAEYLKLKMFEHNPDYLDQDPKFIVPNQSKHFYFMAMSQIRLMHMFEKLFEKLNLMKKDEFGLFEKELTTVCRQTIGKHGYQKLEKSTNE
jgi:hypothetical protein